MCSAWRPRNSIQTSKRGTAPFGAAETLARSASEGARQRDVSDDPRLRVGLVRLRVPLLAGYPLGAAVSFRVPLAPPVRIRRGLAALAKPVALDEGSRRRGVTLLELLIVMTIMLMITAAAIPVILPATQNRRMREAARLTSSYISGARSRAIESGRPVGVMIERFNGLPYALNLSYCEVPPPYAGDTLSSRITVAAGGITGFVPSSDILWQNVVRVGDLVQLDYKGPLYVIAPFSGLTPGATLTSANLPTTTTPWTLLLPSGATPLLPTAYGAVGVPYQIFRQPVRSSAAPMQLPEGVVVDLINSGVTTSGVFPTTFVAPINWLTTPPVPWNAIITFAPSGRVDFVTLGTAGTLTRPTGPIFLLLGRRDLMADVSQTGNDDNLYDSTNTTNAYLQNFWVTVGYQTGLVTVTENAVNNNAVPAARAFAQQSQSLGGR
jgi:prepilin-type N-terminal cleavage/methylation domain-containing protein